MDNNETRQKDLDLQLIVRALLDHIWVIIIFTAVCGALVYGYTRLFIQPIYKSTAKLYILNTDNTGESKLNSGDISASSLTQDYMIIIKGKSVLETVIKELNLDMNFDELQNSVSVRNPSNTRILEITVSTVSSLEAQVVAQKISEVALISLKETMGLGSINIIENAYRPTVPSSPDTFKNTAAGALAGMVISSAVFILWTYLTDSINTSEDVKNKLGLNFLAEIPYCDAINTDAAKKMERKRLMSRKNIKFRKLGYHTTGILRRK